MNIMSAIIHRFFPEPEVKAAPAGAPKDNKKVIAAITAAIKHHREG
jgi:oxaloacetate decarboxylase gamma subunit